MHCIIYKIIIDKEKTFYIRNDQQDRIYCRNKTTWIDTFLLEFLPLNEDLNQYYAFISNEVYKIEESFNSNNV